MVGTEVIVIFIGESVTVRGEPAHSGARVLLLQNREVSLEDSAFGFDEDKLRRAGLWP